MTVYSINKRTIEQASNMTPAANAKSSSDAAQEFVSALQQAGSMFSAVTRSPSAETALKAHFDRPADENRSAKAAEKAERAEVKQTPRSRSRDDKSDGNAGKVKAKDTRDDQAPAKAESAEAVAKPAAKESEDDTVTVAAPADQQDAAADKQAAAPQIIVAPVQAPQQQVQETVAEDAAATLVAADVLEDGQPVEAGAAKEQKGKAAQASDGELADDAGDMDGLDTLTADAAQAGQTARRSGHGADKDARDAHADAQSQAQADDLAKRLDGTGAQLKMQVQVNSAAQAGAGDSFSTTPDLLAAQDLAAMPQTASAQNGADGAPDDVLAAGPASAAQQAAAANALEAAAQQSRLAQAKPLDPALLAQLEASNQADAPAQQNATPVVGGANATTAAQKAAAPQAAQAPRFQLPQQEEVMDQVSVQILKQAKNGNDSIKVQLKPVELGAIEIKLEVGKDGRVLAIVTADNKETLDMLQKDASNLHKALEEAGLKPDRDSMSFNLREGQQQTQQNGNGGTGRRRSRLTVAAEADAAAGALAAQAQARWSASRSGVDIKV